MVGTALLSGKGHQFPIHKPSQQDALLVEVLKVSGLTSTNILGPESSQVLQNPADLTHYLNLCIRYDYDAWDYIYFDLNCMMQWMALISIGQSESSDDQVAADWGPMLVALLISSHLVLLCESTHLDRCITRY